MSLLPPHGTLRMLIVPTRLSSRAPRLIHTAIMVSALVTLALPSAAQSPTPVDSRPLIDALRVFIPRVMKLEGTPGLNIAVAVDGKVIWEEGFGYADIDRKIPMTSSTVTHSGSMGKTYVATAVMQLVERGIIGLDDPIGKYITDIRIVNPLGPREITVRDLLTHRAGLTSNSAGATFDSPEPLGDRLRKVYASPTMESYGGTLAARWTAKVGEKWQYSNIGIATLGYLVQVTNPEKLTFSEYVQRHIMNPLGMRSSQYPAVQDAAHVKPEIMARFSKGYATLGAMQIPTPTIYFADFPAGTAVLTPSDHLRLLLAYMGNGTYNGYQLLKPETVRLMLTPQAKTVGDEQVGLVWFLKNIDKPDYNFSHGGSHMYGWMNDFRAYPNQKLAFAIFTNHWPISHPRYHEVDLIAGFIVSWLDRVKAGRSLPVASSWAWKKSYVMGLILGEQLKPAMGVEQPVTDTMVEAMAAGARPKNATESRADLWDESGFRQGVADVLGVVPQTYPGIRAFYSSDGLRILPQELALIYREMGLTGTEDGQ